MNTGENFIWHEKYAPKTIKEIILPSGLKNDLQQMLEQGDFQHLLFSGPPGIGKTTVARALANELNLDLLYVNSSLENGIDEVRTKITTFASTISIGGKMKMVLMDEADNLSEAAQKGLRGVMDTFSNTRFIFTCNYERKILEPILERCSQYDFFISKEESKELLKEMYQKIVYILDAENIEYEKSAVIKLLKEKFPNFRKTIIKLQEYALKGKIDDSIFSTSRENQISELVEIVKTKKFDAMREWVGQNVMMDKDLFFGDLYSQAKQFLIPNSIPQLVLLLNDYQYKAKFVKNQEINTAAFLTEVMSSCEFK